MYHPRRAPQAPVETILDVATHLFYQRGIGAVGVDTIVADSGVSKATLYRHFASKDQLVAAVLRRSDQLWREHLVEAIDQRANDPRDKLLTIFDWLGEWFTDEHFHGCAFLNANADLTSTHPAHDIPRQHKMAVRQYLLTLATEAGLGEPDQLADEFLLLIDGAIAHALLEGNPTPAARAKRLAQLALQAHATET